MSLEGISSIPFWHRQFSSTSIPNWQSKISIDLHESIIIIVKNIERSLLSGKSPNNHQLNDRISFGQFTWIAVYRLPEDRDSESKSDSDREQAERAHTESEAGTLHESKKKRKDGYPIYVIYQQRVNLYSFIFLFSMVAMCGFFFFSLSSYCFTNVHHSFLI